MPLKSMRLWISFILILSVIICSVVSVSAYDYVSYSYSPDSVKVFSDSFGSFLACADGGDLYIEKIAPDSFSRTLTLPYPILDYLISMDQATVICTDNVNRQTVVFYYDIGRDALDSFAVSEKGFSTDIGFAADQTGIYLRSGNPNVIWRYSYTGRREYQYEFSSAVTCITQDQSGSVYAIADHLLYRADGKGITTFSGDEVYRFARFLSDDMLIDSYGVVYSISSGAAQRVFLADSGCFGSVVSDACYLAFGKTVTRYTRFGEKTGYLTFDAPVISVVSDDDCVAVITNENGLRVNYLSDSDFIEVNRSKNAAVDIDSSADPSPSITSDLYRIDYEKRIIYAIPAKTSVSLWKSHMTYDGYALTLYQGNTVRKSGNIATAMTADFSLGDAVSFELCVGGDLTGEGNVNSKDRKALLDFLLGSWNLTGAYLCAADINIDNSVDLLDAVTICRMTE